MVKYGMEGCRGRGLGIVEFVFAVRNENIP